MVFHVFSYHYIGKFVCIREQFKSSNGFLKFAILQCVVATTSCFFSLRNRQRIRISETRCTFSPKKRAERHAGPRKMDLQMDQKVRIFFLLRFCEKDE